MFTGLKDDLRLERERHANHLSVVCLQLSRAEDDIREALASQNRRTLDETAANLHGYHRFTRDLAMQLASDNGRHSAPSV